MTPDRIGLAEVLAAAEEAAPLASPDVVARNLRDRFGARYVSFLFVDVIGRKLVRVSEETATQEGRRADQVDLHGSVYDEVLRSQQLVCTSSDGERWHRVIAPVTNRGDTIGVLELSLPDVGEDVLEQVEEAAHALAYLVVTDRRFTDLYQWGRRTTGLSLAAEIQCRLLPSAPSCEAAEFALSCALVPADTIAGDTCDHTLDHNTLHLSLTDAMGHDIDASLMRLCWSTPPGVPVAPGPTWSNRHAGPIRRCSTTAATPSPPASCCASPSTGAAPSSSTPAIPGRRACGTARSKRSPWRPTCPSASPPRTAPTRCRTSICAPATAWCSTPTVCKGAGPGPSTCPA